MVYGIPPSDDPSPSSRVEYDISKLRLYLSKILAEDESVSVCKAYRVGPVGANGDNRPLPLKVILSSEQDLQSILSRKRKLASLAPNIFFHRNFSLPERLKYRALKEEIPRRSNQGETNLVILDGKIISRPIIQK